MNKLTYAFFMVICTIYSGLSQTTQTIRAKIAAGADDAEIGTSLYTQSSDLELGGFDSYNSGKQYVALRFQNVALPSNAQVSKAYIQFTTKTARSVTAVVTIRCQQGNAAAYVANQNLLSRTYVPTIVNWSPPAWTIANESNAKQQTADLSAQINAAISTGWQSGNSLSFILQGNATQNDVLNARSYEHNSTRTGVPELVIEYGINTNPCANDIIPPTFTNCPANINLTTTGTNAVASWTAPTVSDNCTAAITPSVSTAPTAGLVSGSAFPVGITTVTYAAKDAANNNAAPCSFTVTVINNNPCTNDVTPPAFANCPANINLTTTSTNAIASWTTPSVSDNCTAAITPSVSTAPTAGLASGSAFPIGITTVTYAAKDAANNNAAPCTFTVTVAPPPASTIFINEVAPQGTVAISSDWIELYNSSTTAVSLNDVYISGKKTTPFKWQLKNLSIPAKGFLILLADKDTLKGLAHIDLKLSAGGEKLYLFRNVNGTAVELSFFEFPATPAEEDNVTFGGLTEGVAAPAPAALTKFMGGTPNAANASGIRYFKMSNSLPRGILSAPVTVTLNAPVGTIIRYTTNHSMPSRTNGTIYTQPIAINATTVLKTLAYSDNSETKVESYTYIFPVKGSELKFPDLVTAAEYEAGLKLLPIISVSTNVDIVDSKTEKIASFEYINKFGENASIGVICGVNGYGNDSYLNSEQRNLRVKFKGEYGFGKLKYPIFKKDDVDTYKPTDEFDVLDLKVGQDGPSADGFGMVMTSQGLISKTMREMGNIDLHTQYTHVYVNGVYHGVYTLKEHWDEHFGETYYGGDKELYDNIESSWERGRVNTNSAGVPQGTITNWNALRSAATANNFQTVKTYLNVNQFIDMMLTTMYFDNEWEYRAIADQSLKATKFVVENHDTDGALVKTSDENEYTYDVKWTDPSVALVFNGPGGIFGNLYRGGNKEFKTLVRDRVYDAFQTPTGALTVGRISTKLNELKSIIKPVFNIELARFNATFYNDSPYFDEEFDANMAHLPTRFQYNLDKWLSKGLKHTLLPVAFNQPSGTVTTPVLATNPNAGGSIYYTLDGSDPMGNDGVISPLAKLYTNQLALNVGVNKVVARVYFNAEFGPKTTATYTSATVVAALQAAQILTAQARLDGQTARISWVTKTSQGADYFQVEKLNNQGIFETLETVNAMSSNNHREGVEAYSSLDTKPHEGDNFYRVALFSDALNTPQYSELLKVKFSTLHSYELYPNPSSDFVDIDLKSVEGKAVSIVLFNSIGIIVLTEKIAKAAVSKRINVEKLGTGQYFVSIQAEGKKVVMKKVTVAR